jgi:hypothetical protein
MRSYASEFSRGKPTGASGDIRFAFYIREALVEFGVAAAYE